MPSKAAVIIILTIPINKATKAQRETRAALGNQQDVNGTGNQSTTSHAFRETGRV